MKHFRLVDNVMGCLAFLVAAIVYCSTVEPTASFWDCPEFITTGYKLEVGHPPGAPFFMLTANFFSLFASDPSQVAYMVNIMNALLSAATILFLFWSISHLTRRLLIKADEEMTLSKLIAVEASALVGALIYTFSDTFWYSAVEGEVYAYSSALTALVFWLILKWEENADKPHADRWIVLIMFITGLSIGVHLLNLLCLPAIVLVYFYRRFPQTKVAADIKGSIIALCISFVLLAAVLYGVVPGIVKVGGWFEMFFVNTLGMPFNTGVILYIVLLLGTMIWGIRETYQNQNDTRCNVSFLMSIALLGIPFYGHGVSSVLIGVVVLGALYALLNFKKNGVEIVTKRIKNTALLCMLMLTLGYSSYAVIVIRSSANPPMDQNSPEDIFTLGEYLGREQYGSRPLFYGHAYSSGIEWDTQTGSPVMSKGAPVYNRKEKASADEKDSYYQVRTKDDYVYAQQMLFPRMYSSDSRHVAAYQHWTGGIKGRNVKGKAKFLDMNTHTLKDGGESVKIPTQLENLHFFIAYQCNWMYWRYFMWNFAGRQNDIQGHGELEHGNWISGIDFIDNARLGDQDNLPDSLKDNKGHNVYYCLPLLLGLIGLVWQFCGCGRKGARQFWVVFFLFFMTGLAIVIYLNQTPYQPRERDYAYAGSFYAFAIWCGLGVAAIYTMLTQYIKKYHGVLAAIVGAACLLVPIQMGSQNWDDHDRSGRYMARDFGQNYLMSLPDEGNPIIFTNGDNDTFPLWYNQDTEGFRTDARVCNLSYLQTDWYIDQMKRPAYDSPAVPITWPRLDYVAGTNESIGVMPELREVIEEWYIRDSSTMKQCFGDQPFELKNLLKVWVRNDVDASTLEVMRYICREAGIGDTHVIPTDVAYLTIDSAAVRQSGMMMVENVIPERMEIKLPRSLHKSNLMILDMLAECNWTRPIFVAITVGGSALLNLDRHLVLEGLVQRITPFDTSRYYAKDYDVDRNYDILMNRFKFGGLETPDLYLDETIMRMCYTHRNIYMQLADELANAGDTVRAQQVLDFAQVHIPEYNVPACVDSGSLMQAAVNYKLGNIDEANRIMDILWNNASQYVAYYFAQANQRFPLSNYRTDKHLRNMYYQLMTAYQHEDNKWAESHASLLDTMMNEFTRRGGRLGEWYPGLN